jgi:hypothetical protein
MEPTAFWRDLQALFRALPDPMGDLRAMDMEDGTWSLSGGPRDETQRQSLERQFRALATRAALGAGLTAEPTLLDAWLNRLRRDPYWVPVATGTEVTDRKGRVVEEGWIENLTIASAEYCVELETEAYARDTANATSGGGDSQSPELQSDPLAGARMVGGPALAAWLSDHMHRTQMTVNRIHELCNIDRKTVNKMLQGRAVRALAITKLVQGLAIDRADIPMN